MVHPLSVALQLCFYTFACIFIVLFTSLSQKIRSGDSFTGCSQFDRGPFFDRVRLREAPDSSSHSEPAEPAYSKEAYFAMCLIVKDQGPDILEWIEYHRLVGAAKFYIFDHNSTVPMIRELHPLVQAGLVHYEYVIEFPAKDVYVQSYAYNQCMQELGPRYGHSWMALTDADEFLILTDPGATTMPALLREYEAYGGLGVNWRVFGSSGHVDKPEGGTLANFVTCIPQAHAESSHIKTIVHIPYGKEMGPDPHHALYTPGKYAVDENFERIDGPRTVNASYRRVALNHYPIKSLEEFKIKAIRGAAHGVRTKTMKYWEYVEALATDTCGDAVDLGRLVMQRLAEAAKPKGLIVQPSPQPDPDTDQPPPSSPDSLTGKEEALASDTASTAASGTTEPPHRAGRLDMAAEAQEAPALQAGPEDPGLLKPSGVPTDTLQDPEEGQDAEASDSHGGTPKDIDDLLSMDLEENQREDDVAGSEKPAAEALPKQEPVPETLPEQKSGPETLPERKSAGEQGAGLGVAAVVMQDPAAFLLADAVLAQEASAAERDTSAQR